MSVTLLDIRDEVMSLLGDEQYFREERQPSFVFGTELLDRAIRASLREHVKISEARSAYPLEDDATIDVTAGVQEYNLNDWLTDGDGNPNYRGNLFIVRESGVDKPVPVYWHDAGSHWTRHVLALIGYQFSDSVGTVDAWGNYSTTGTLPPPLAGLGPILYRRGNSIGFVTAPTQTIEGYLRAYYNPRLTWFFDDGATLDSISLGLFDDQLQQIALFAAHRMAASKASGISQLLYGQWQKGLDDFKSAMDKWAMVYDRVRPCVGMEW